METIRGKTPHTLDLTELHTRLANYNRIILDLGTGDGKFAFSHAQTFPHHFVIGVDSCRENLREYSRAKLTNLLFVIASAQSLPHELSRLVSHITINFPWGSLLGSLLSGDPLLMRGLETIAQPSASLDLRLNGGALSEQGWSLEKGAEQIRENLLRSGWQVGNPMRMDARALRSVPTTWAKRLAFGRDPRAVQMGGVLNS
jgi:16S rRNA (adenine(1408)-N(1))-methyltransferase